MKYVLLRQRQADSFLLARESDGMFVGYVFGNITRYGENPHDMIERRFTNQAYALDWLKTQCGLGAEFETRELDSLVIPATLEQMPQRKM